MRSRLGKEIRKIFTAELERHKPPFKKIPSKLSFATIFAFKCASNLTFYIEIFMHSMYDHFDIYIAWSDDESIPHTDGNLPPPEAKRSPLVFIRKLWGGQKPDLWWEIAPAPTLERPESFYEVVPLEQCLQQVQPTVADALRCIDQYAMPYFAQVAAAHNLDFPLSL